MDATKGRGTFFITCCILFATQTEARCFKDALSVESPVVQAIQSDLIVVGTITGFESDLVTLEPADASGKPSHAIATIRIEEGLYGAAGLTHVRVAFVPEVNYAPRQQFARRFNARRIRTQSNGFVLGQEACFFLQKACTDLYVCTTHNYVLDKSDSRFANDVKGVKKIACILKEPKSALRSNDAHDRQLAACVLIRRYRTTPRNVLGGPLSSVTYEAIPADESKLILQALSEMKWGETPFDANGALSLQSAFSQLSLGDKDGWIAPTQKEDDDYNAVMSAAVSKWFKEKSSGYRLQCAVHTHEKAN